MTSKPIRVFWSPLSEKFYASQHYRIDQNGIVTITGEKYDVTQDIAQVIVEEDVAFRRVDVTEGDSDAT